MKPFAFLKEVAPWARIATLIILGVTVIYAIGRWDAAIDSELRQLEADSRAALKRFQATHRWVDSLTVVDSLLGVRDDSLRFVESLQELQLEEVRREHEREHARVAVTPLDSLLKTDLLRPLRFRSLDVSTPAGPRVVYALDSAGVRTLAYRLLSGSQAEVRLARSVDLLFTRDRRISTLEGRVAVLTAARDSLVKDLGVAAPLIERHLEAQRCRILWLIPCPSRVQAFAGGLVLGGLIIYGATR